MASFRVCNRTLLVSLLVILLSGHTLSQSLPTPLTLSSGRAIALLESGDILLAGFTLTEREGAAPSARDRFRRSVFLSLFSSGGEQQWLRFIDTPAGTTVDHLTLTEQGELYLTGRLHPEGSQAALAQQLRRGDTFIARYAASGEPLWLSSIDTGNATLASSSAVSDQGVVVASVVSTGHDGDEAPREFTGFVLLTQFSLTGEQLWSTAFQLPDNYSPYSQGIALHDGGDIVLVGHADERAALDIFYDRRNRFSDPIGIDVFVARFNADGELLWLDMFGAVMIDRGHAAAVTAEGHVFVTGNTPQVIGDLDYEGTMGSSIDAFLASYNAAGQQRWIRQFGQGRGYSGEALATDSLGRVVVVGWGGGDAFIVMYDADGQQLWADRLGTERFDGAFAVTVGADDMIYVSGHLDLSPGAGLDLTYNYPNCQFNSVKVGENQCQQRGMDLDEKALVATCPQLLDAHALQLTVHGFDTLAIAL
jgi:hypothetical protein